VNKYICGRQAVIQVQSKRVCNKGISVTSAHLTVLAGFMICGNKDWPGTKHHRPKVAGTQEEQAIRKYETRRVCLGGAAEGVLHKVR
jgi:hypothetical protein